MLAYSIIFFYQAFFFFLPWMLKWSRWLCLFQKHNSSILSEEEKKLQLTAPKTKLLQNCKHAILGVCKGFDLFPLNSVRIFIEFHFVGFRLFVFFFNFDFNDSNTLRKIFRRFLNLLVLKTFLPHVLYQKTGVTDSYWTLSFSPEGLCRCIVWQAQHEMKGSTAQKG